MQVTKIFTITLGALLAFPALAEEAPASLSSPVAYNIGVVSDYVFRGITQTTHAPAVQGGADYTHSTGLYVGTWASNVKWIKDRGAIATGDSGVELDTYFGIKNSVATDYGYDVGYIRYNYLGSYTPQLGYNNADTAEIYGAASYKFVTLKYSYSLLDGFLTIPSAKGTNYIDLTANYPFDAAGMTIGAHVGKQTFVGAAESVNGVSPTYNDYRLSASKDFSSYVVSLAYSNTNATSFWTLNGDPWGQSATTLSVTHAF